MKKVLIIEITVFVLLIGLAVCALAGVFSPSDVPLETTETTAETVAQPVFEVVVSPKPKADWETFPGRKLTCERFFVYDCETNTMMAQYGEDTKLYPASITKLLTAYTALQYLKPADKVVAGDALDLVAADSSIAFIRRGDTLVVEQLVEAMMLPSGNDAAYITAVAAGREIANDPELAPAEAADVFVRQMNITAKNAGMTGSNFMNPDGYHHDNHYTCFRDMAILGELAMTNELIVKYTALPEGNNPNFDEDEGIPQWENTNFLIHPDNEFYCSYAKGLKTGNTSLAGKCLLSAFNYEGRKLIIGVFGCPEYADRFMDTLYIFSHVIGAVK